LESHSKTMAYKVFFSVTLIYLTYVRETISHGFMYHPSTWNDQKDTDPNLGPFQIGHGVVYPRPEKYCDGTQGLKCSPAIKNLKKGIPQDWFTNYTFNENGPTLNPNLYDRKKRKQFNPWMSPGSAPIYGGGCGANGGNPYGCQAQSKTFQSSATPDPNPYGTCCAGPKNKKKKGCGAYSGGKSAKIHAINGLFDGAVETTWSRGRRATVTWASRAQHGGGYAYRLCKIPQGGISEINEKCFQSGHLKFVGQKTWVAKNPPKGKKQIKNWIALNAIRTKKGTYPPRSQWTKITLPPGQKANEYVDWAFKDIVRVPKNITPGKYILSWRWDCENTPQVWSSCANINIV